MKLLRNIMLIAIGLFLFGLSFYFMARDGMGSRPSPNEPEQPLTQKDMPWQAIWLDKARDVACYRTMTSVGAVAISCVKLGGQDCAGCAEEVEP